MSFLPRPLAEELPLPSMPSDHVTMAADRILPELLDETMRLYRQYPNVQHPWRRSYLPLHRGKVP